MKKILFSILAVAACGVSIAQTKGKVVPVIKKPVAPTGIKTLLDSFSYAAGYNIAMNMKEQGITNVNTTLIQKALNDAFQNKASVLSQDQTNSSLQNQIKIFAAKKEVELKAPGIAFLGVNSKRRGVTTLPDGLQYEILTAGPAGKKPTLDDTVVVNYAGTLINGTEFENSYKSGQAATFKLTQVISGWTEILQMMTVGSKWRVYIPSELAYGMNPRDPKTIPPGSALIFEISLESIKPGTPAPSN